MSQAQGFWSHGDCFQAQLKGGAPRTRVGGRTGILVGSPVPRTLVPFLHLFPSGGSVGGSYTEEALERHSGKGL